MFSFGPRNHNKCIICHLLCLAAYYFCSAKCPFPLMDRHKFQIHNWLHKLFYWMPLFPPPFSCYEPLFKLDRKGNTTKVSCKNIYLNKTKHDMKETHIETRKKRILKHLKKKEKDNEYKQAMEHLKIIKATKSNQPKLETKHQLVYWWISCPSSMLHFGILNIGPQHSCHQTQVWKGGPKQSVSERKRLEEARRHTKEDTPSMHKL